MKKYIQLIFVACVYFLAGCTPPQKKEQNNTISLAIFSINDYHGAFVEDESKDFPGAANIIETLDSLKQVYPYHLTLACGDNFGGSYFSTATKSTLMPAFYNLCGINISVLGNHEFDNGQHFLALKFAESPYQPKDWTIDYIAANVKYTNGKRPKYIDPYFLQVVPIDEKHEVRILLTGLLTSSTATQTRAANIKGLEFKGDYAEIIRQHTLPADIKLLAAHVGTYQHGDTVVWEDPNSESLKSLTKNDIDGIFSGHTHEKVCGYINADSIPIVQGRCNGTYISMLECIFDTTHNKLLEIKPQLVKVNHHRYWGENAKKMKYYVDETLKITKTDAGYSLGDNITLALEDLSHDRHNKQTFTEVATLVCESYAEAYKRTSGWRDTTEMIVGISHFGSIRTGLSKGEVSVLDTGEALPFFNEMRAYRLTGKEVKALVEFGLHNKKYGWLQTSALRIVCNNEKEKKVTALYYAYNNGKSVKIADNDLLTVVADEYIATGGDGFSTDFFPENKRIKNIKMPKSTDCFIAYLKTKETISTDSTLHKRLTYEK